MRDIGRISRLGLAAAGTKGTRLRSGSILWLERVRSSACGPEMDTVPRCSHEHAIESTTQFACGFGSAGRRDRLRLFAICGGVCQYVHLGPSRAITPM